MVHYIIVITYNTNIIYYESQKVNELYAIIFGQYDGKADT